MTTLAQRRYQQNTHLHSSPVLQVAQILDVMALHILDAKKAIEHHRIADRFEATEKASKLLLGLSSLWSQGVKDLQVNDLLQFMSDFEISLTLGLLEINEKNDLVLCEKAYEN